ncbi:MOSC domain-containing protein [Geodermatophilus sp. DSM 44513]|uniref:MOSC domain-containing protein n=1 Tax=Geodermatophilus sp. DSM 44513 TaxID=1528104 RepID=UPI00126CEC0B|nr:MOSC domain-containing protein [Geodermatophilus sp. DSM 44513]WNV76990.1 MOSC domain-containing protein [Geodermatophilus sp. DSM 44513]
MSARVEAVCVAAAGVLEIPGRGPTRSAIDKRPVPGRVAVRPLGLDGDTQANRKHHGGEGQAVYAYAAEDAAWWEAELDRELPAGRFGENLRTAGIDLTAALLGERWEVGTALLEVTAPRTPCAKFQAYWGVPRLVRRFTEHGAPGAYLRVLRPGDVGAGDALTVVSRPDHGVSIGLAFRAMLTERDRLPELRPALSVLPHKDQPAIAEAIAARTTP